MIDMNKQYTTRGGRPVRLLCVDGPEDFPVIGLICGECSSDSWMSGGSYYDTIDEHGYDLIEVKPKVIVERWFNININRSGKPQIIEYYSESDARLGEPSIHEMRIATAIPFKWTEGDQV